LERLIPVPSARREDARPQWTSWLRAAVALYVGTVPLPWLWSNAITWLRPPHLGGAGLASLLFLGVALASWIVLVLASFGFFALAAATAFNPWRWVMIADLVVLAYGPLDILSQLIPPSGGYRTAPIDYGDLARASAASALLSLIAVAFVQYGGWRSLSSRSPMRFPVLALTALALIALVAAPIAGTELDTVIHRDCGVDYWGVPRGTSERGYLVRQAESRVLYTGATELEMTLQPSSGTEQGPQAEVASYAAGSTDQILVWYGRWLVSRGWSRTGEVSSLTESGRSYQKGTVWGRSSGPAVENFRVSVDFSGSVQRPPGWSAQPPAGAKVVTITYQLQGPTALFCSS
jgi:hypothetical protein